MSVFLSPVGGAGAQFFDNNGNPLTGGKLYTYQAGTTTPEPSYTTSAGNVAHTNPIILDSAGRVPTGEIWITTSVNYKFVMKDANDVLIATWDNINTYVSVDSANVKYIQAGTGAVETTVQDVLREVINVTNYGASPTASSSVNTTAFNNAIAYALQVNRPVYVPPIGTFTIGRLTAVTGDLTIYSTDKTRCVIKVDGTLWPYSSSANAVLQVTGSFYTNGITYDQSWLTAKGDPPGYRDDKNPATWGGYWFVQTIGTTSDELVVENCHVENMCRGFFAQSADPTVGGVKRVQFTNNTGKSTNGPSQTLIASDGPQSFVASNNPYLEAQQWDKSSGNGIAWAITWGGNNVQICDNVTLGYQYVFRGPRSQPWTPNTAYVAGDEYIYVDVTYKVTDAYTSGAGFGAIDLANTVVTINDTLDIQVCRNRIQSPIADTAVYGWGRAVITDNIVTTSGDMGIAASNCYYTNVSNNIVDGTRVGGIDITGGANGSYDIVCANNTVIDIARASSGVYVAIDTRNPNIWASNGGFGLSAVCIGLLSAASSNLTVTGNQCFFRTLPPLTDNKPGGGANLVRAVVNGIYSQTSSNALAFNTTTVTGNRVGAYEADCPNFFVNAPTLRFYNQAVTGTPRSGEIFKGSGVSFVLNDCYPAGGLVFTRKFQGAQVPFSGQFFTGQSSGAVITTATFPQTAYLECTEAGNWDYTSKYLGDKNDNNVLIGGATVDPSSIANGATTSFTISVTNAALGDFVTIAPPYSLQGLELTAYVSAASTVTVVLRNDTGGAIDLASGFWKARVVSGN